MAAIRIQPPSDVLVPGEATRIRLTVVLDEPLKVRGLHATFHGAEETKAVYTTTTYNAATSTAQTQTHTAVQHVEIVKRDYLLSGRERQGFFGNLGDAFATLLGGGEHDVLEPGEYPFEIEVLVPPNGRPTFAGEKCRVFYELSALVDVPLGRDVKALQSFRVADKADPQRPPPAPVRTRYPEDQERGLLDSWFAPDIRVEAALRQSAFRKGDTAEGIFVLETPKPLQYSAIDVRIISVEKTKAHGHTDSHTHPGDPVRIATDGVIEGSYSQEFTLPVSSPGPPTTRGDLFSIDCYVQIELDVPWARDPKVRVPITVLGR